MIKTLKFVAAYLFALPDGAGSGATLCGHFVALGQQDTFTIRRDPIGKLRSWLQPRINGLFGLLPLVDARHQLLKQ